ncbi:uncharacterized protein BJX67DRAFT_384894 [Aspergillus lucknowensis]|uniref:Uncharacterized protein n=1 Tax=Aspergillus lucknowensis TaxID=176173 RepID=A0ABR4LGR2_9EURO
MPQYQHIAAAPRRTRWFKRFQALETNILLVLFFILFAVFAVLSGIFYQTVSWSDPRLLRPPYHPDIWLGTQLPLFTGCAALGWTILTCYPQVRTWHRSKYWWLIQSVFRVAVGVLLCASLGIQAQYMPTPLGSCENADRWPDEDDAAVPPGTPTAWEIMRPPRIRTAGKVRAVQACGFFLHVWRFEIALGIILFLSAAIALVMWWIFDDVSEEMGFHLQETGYISRLLAPPLRYWIASSRRKSQQNMKTTAAGSRSRSRRSIFPFLARSKGKAYDSLGPSSSPAMQMEDIKDIDTDTSTSTSTSTPTQCDCDVAEKPFRCWGCGMDMCRVRCIPPSPDRHALF